MKQYPERYRHGYNVQFRWVRRWWLIFPYAKLQFRERMLAPGTTTDPDAQWSPWLDIYTENERD